MKPIKWLRKNKNKIMVVVIFIAIVGFVLGTSLQQLSKRSNLGEVVAYFGDNEEITREDLILARQELEILQKLGAGSMLKNIGLPTFKTFDMRCLMLSELLFSGNKVQLPMLNAIRQSARIREYRIRDKQISDIYKQEQLKDIYWLLLKEEAQQAGIKIPEEATGKQLAMLIPASFQGVTYSKFMEVFIKQTGVSENRILTAFSRLLEILAYSRAICSAEDITSSQITHQASTDNEIISVEYVRIDSSAFSDTQQEPSQQQITSHFEKYKKNFSGQISDDNPYGFGYKLPDRVQLEYIALKTDDIKNIVEAPTAEDVEEYYQKNQQQFVEKIPSDSNDPNSPLKERIRSFAEVANIIPKQLLGNKINLKANKILQEAKDITEVELKDIDVNSEQISPTEISKKAEDYKTAADKLSKKYKIKVYSGKTGLLSIKDIDEDEHLPKLHIRGDGYNVVWLTEMVFAVDKLKGTESGHLGPLKPKLYENIGPLREVPNEFGEMLGEIMAVTRVIKAIKATEPETINHTHSRQTLRLNSDKEQSEQKVYSTKEKVVEDLKRLAAMEVTKRKAEEFKDMAVKDGWEKAAEKFNKQYGKQASKDSEEPNAFGLQKMPNLKKVSKNKLKTLWFQTMDDPTGSILVNESKKAAMFIDKLYDLLPKEKDTLDNAPVIIEFKGDMSYYCIKELSVKHLNQDEYEMIKSFQAYKDETANFQSLATVHFNPKNIQERLRFRMVEKEEDTEKTTKSEGNPS
ncbi:MAG: hypothetical protein ACYSSI_01375 [Planctomycetota bacterium]|jgi:hypothetical protein